MLEYSALIEGREEDGLRVTFLAGAQKGIVVDFFTPEGLALSLSSEQLGEFLAEYTKFNLAAKCVEVV